MGFKRPWDSSCPRVWDSWEENGKTWVIQDLPPEDDEEALQMLVNIFCPDEVLCVHSDLLNDPESVNGISAYWRKYLALRTSLACYVEEFGTRKLIALNVCVFSCEDDEIHDEIIGERFKNVYAALTLVESKVDKFKLLEVDKILYAMGLLVAREYRGYRLGSKMLAAREPLCRHYGIKGTATIFTGPASQRSAERAGFATVNMKEMADAGLKYPRDETKEIKLMIKKYDCE